MKTTSTNLNTALYGAGSDRPLAVDCYKLTFPNGAILLLTGGDAAVTIGADTYQVAGVLTRGRAQVSSGDEVSSMALEIVPAALAVSGVPLLGAAQRGYFDDALVQVRRCVDPTTYGENASKGTVPVFTGVVDEVEPTSTLLHLVVKSVASLFRGALPRRVIQPQCPFNVYDADCGVDPTTFTHARTAAAGSTATSLVLNTSSANAVIGSWVTGTSGANTGETRLVTAVAGAVLSLDVQLPVAPTIGDGFSVKKGCAKNRPACSGFSNIARHGGTPEAVHEDS